MSVSNPASGDNFCAYHKERIAIDTCVKCRKRVCAECQVIIKGAVFCGRCASGPLPGLGYSGKRSPIVAALWSFIPGIGQVYNGQVIKGVIIFLTSWLIIPWLYGIWDAYIVAKKINKGEILTNVTREYVDGCLLLVAVIVLVPLAVFGIFRQDIFSFFVSRNESAAQEILRKVSEASENFAKAKGYYPQNYSDLYRSDPPFLDEVYCDVRIDEYTFDCLFSSKGYTLTARPVSKKAKTTYTVRTGGLMTPKIEAESWAFP